MPFNFQRVNAQTCFRPWSIEVWRQIYHIEKELLVLLYLWEWSCKLCFFFAGSEICKPELFLALSHSRFSLCVSKRQRILVLEYWLYAAVRTNEARSVLMVFYWQRNLCSRAGVSIFHCSYPDCNDAKTAIIFVLCLNIYIHVEPTAFKSSKLRWMNREFQTN